MAIQSVRGAPARFSKRDNDRSEVGNIILRGLPPAEWTQLFASLEFVRLRLHQVLHEVGEAIKSGYFERRNEFGADGAARWRKCRGRPHRQGRLRRLTGNFW